MIRTTDAMIKAVNVIKAKERLQDTIDAQQKAKAAGRNDLESVFEAMVAGCREEIAALDSLLRNPAA